MDPISATGILEVSGDALRQDIDQVGASIMDAIDEGRAVLVRGYLSPEQVQAVRANAETLNHSVPITHGRPVLRRKCPDIHNREAPHFRWQDRIRALVERRKLRFRRFHGYKLFLWNERPASAETAFLDVIRLRNRLYEVDPDFAIEDDQDFFTMVCIQHYECGGSFLSEHSDADFHVRQGLHTRFEIITLLSKKGVDYDEGGLFIRIDGVRRSIDDYAEPGDLVVYDVKRPHGCAPVDPKKQPDPEGRKGRWIMLVPPFSNRDHMVQ